MYHEVIRVPFFLFFCRNTFNQSNPFDRRCPYLGTVDVTVPLGFSYWAIIIDTSIPQNLPSNTQSLLLGAHWSPFEQWRCSRGPWMRSNSQWLNFSGGLVNRNARRWRWLKKREDRQSRDHSYSSEGIILNRIVHVVIAGRSSFTWYQVPAGSWFSGNWIGFAWRPRLGYRRATASITEHPTCAIVIGQAQAYFHHFHRLILTIRGEFGDVTSGTSKRWCKFR